MATFLQKKFDPATLDSLANFICGDDISKYPVYRSSTYLTKFFTDLAIFVCHDGTTRKWWVLNVLNQLNINDLEKVVLRLVDIREYKADRTKLELAQKSMSDILFMEDMDIVFQGKDPILVPLNTSIDLNIKTQDDDLSEEEFLRKDFDEGAISKIGLDSIIEDILKQRINEAHVTLNNKTPLASIFMSGSTLEGVLLGVATLFPREFNQAISSPKKNDGSVKFFQDWALNDFINVAAELSYIGIDVKKFSHVLRDFRNYIHPYQQMSSKFNPDLHTAKICFHVLNAAISDLTNIKKSL